MNFQVPIYNFQSNINVSIFKYLNIDHWKLIVN